MPAMSGIFSGPLEVSNHSQRRAGPAEVVAFLRGCIHASGHPARSPTRCAHRSWLGRNHDVTVEDEAVQHDAHNKTP